LKKGTTGEAASGRAQRDQRSIVTGVLISAKEPQLTRLPLDDPGWSSFVHGRADATPYHDPAWACLLADCYGLSGFVLAQLDESGMVRGGIPLLAPPRLPGRPRRLVSLPFTDALEPLIEKSLAAAVEDARRELGIARIELRGPLAGARPVETHAVTHTLALAPDPDQMLRGLNKAKRRDVRLALSSSLSVRVAVAERDLTETYYRLHVDTRRRLGVPSQPKRFFRLLWQRIIEPGLGFVVLAEQGGVAVAGAVFLSANGTIVYKFAASDASRRTSRPNELLLWAAIEHACERGLETLDFGRSEVNATGLRRFKTSWGAVEEPLAYSALGDAGRAAIPATPGTVGALLRRAPAWVTRATGALLYRFAA
jgi:CelD/BcsL family acetyltransferase involved in cellulose biosynthesis